MGWNQPFLRPNNIKFFLDDKYTTDNGVVLGSEVVQSATNKQEKTYYAAWQNNQTKEVSAIITRIHDDETGFSYQTQEESWFPDECYCPKSFFYLLTETKNDSAKKWRSTVEAFHKVLDAVLSIKVGQSVEFGDEMKIEGFLIESATLARKDSTFLYFECKTAKRSTPYSAKISKSALLRMIENGSASITGKIPEVVSCQVCLF
jgi:hypothetical protein